MPPTRAAEAKSVKDEAEATTGQMQQTYDSLSAEAQELMLQGRKRLPEKARQEAAAVKQLPLPQHRRTMGAVR